jgi:probable HAF family extracellular repeat protein
MRTISGFLLAGFVLLTPALARSTPAISSVDIDSLGGSRSDVIMLGLTNPGVVYSYDFTWTPAGGYQVPPIQVPSQVVTPNLSIRVMNNNGAVAGVFTDALPDTPWNTFSNGFYWSSTEGFFRLGYDVTPKFLNDNGEVAGDRPPGSSNRHAIYWSRTRGLIDLGTLGGQYSSPAGINASGQVAGQSELATQETHAFLWTPGGNSRLKDLGTLGGRNSYASGLNNAGQVVGNADTAAGQSHATLWDKTKTTDLLPTSLSSSAVAINSLGHVIGRFWNGNTRSFFWKPGAPALDIGSLWGTADARALNDADQVTGVSETNTYKNRAFLWSPTMTQMQDLGADSERSSSGLSINASGAVMGECVDASGTRKGFYYAAGIRSLIIGLPMPDTTAVGITDGGRVGGHSRNIEGYTRAFTWTATGGMTELATPAGYHSFAVATSSAGHVLGRYGDSTYTQGWFLWSPDTGQVSLVTGTTDPNSGDSIQLSEAFSVNGSGQVVGTGQIYKPGVSITPALFVWTVTGGAKAYTNPLSNGLLPTAISDAGQVVGYMYVSGYQTHAFSWKFASGFIDLGTLGGATSTAVAVNEVGQVAGSADTTTTSHAFLYGKKMQDLGSLSQDYSQAVSLNNAGVVIGIGYTTQGEIHPFLRDNRMLDLGTLGGTAAFPKALNEKNEVVGRSYTLTGSDTQAFLWTSATGMRNLGAETTWVKSEAAGINENGQVVVNAFPPDGSSRVVVFNTR